MPHEDREAIRETASHEPTPTLAVEEDGGAPSWSPRQRTEEQRAADDESQRAGMDRRSPRAVSLATLRALRANQRLAGGSLARYKRVIRRSLRRQTATRTLHNGGNVKRPPAQRRRTRASAPKRGPPSDDRELPPPPVAPRGRAELAEPERPPAGTRVDEARRHARASRFARLDVFVEPGDFGPTFAAAGAEGDRRFAWRTGDTSALRRLEQAPGADDDVVDEDDPEPAADGACRGRRVAA
jgi:hypothetical protein